MNINNNFKNYIKNNIEIYRFDGLQPLNLKNVEDYTK